MMPDPRRTPYGLSAGDHDLVTKIIAFGYTLCSIGDTMWLLPFVLGCSSKRVCADRSAHLKASKLICVGGLGVQGKTTG
jgi:hypothetical protein